MTTLVLDQRVEETIRAARAATGADRWDEVWEGTYVMSPLPNNEHLEIVAQLTTILQVTVGWPELAKVLPGVNVSDRLEGWEHNYRCPDVAVFLKDGTARNRDTFWLGGPDFAIEVLSQDDRGRDKIPFYAQVGVGELLLIDRDPWALELCRLQKGRLLLVGRSTLELTAALVSEVVPLTFRIVPGEPRPMILVAHRPNPQSWLV